MPAAHPLARPKRVQGEQAMRHYKITVSNADKAMMLRIERFILAYDGNDLLHDIELNFPGASYRAFYLALGRSQDAARWFAPEGVS
jgi:hypothetical protein